MLPPGALFELKIHQNACAAGASSRTPLEKLTELPDPLAGFEGADSRQGRGGKGRGKREGGKGKGNVPPLLFLQFNDCSVVIVAVTYTRSLDLAFQLVCSSVCHHHAD